eukprot:2545676-Amphidinium_carterae.1
MGSILPASLACLSFFPRNAFSLDRHFVSRVGCTAKVVQQLAAFVPSKTHSTPQSLRVLGA